MHEQPLQNSLDNHQEAHWRREFTRLFNPALRREALVFAGRVLGSNRVAWAEDAVQTAATRAFANFAKFNEGTDFKAWFWKILRNTILSYHRNQNYRGRHEQGELQGEDGKLIDFPDATLPVDERLGQKRQYVRARRALKKVPPEMRQAVMGHVLEGQTYEEVAAEQGIASGTAMSRVHRGLKHLRKAYGSEDQADKAA